MSNPGTTPARKRSPMDVLARRPKMTKGMLGGMMGPIVLDAAVTAAAYAEW